MGELMVMTTSGHVRAAWDYAAAMAGDPAAQSDVREAGRLFAEANAGGGTAFSLADGRPAIRIARFDAAAERIMITTRITGG